MLPPTVILPGQLHLEGWIHNDLDDHTLIAVSDTGYCNDEIALDWLKHFGRFSALRQAGSIRLLLLDNYGSYIIFKFL